MKSIHLSRDLELPADAVTQKIAFLARSGAGKTYAAGKLVEELAAAKAQVVVVDPVGVWWGLRLAADGKHPGIKDFYVFGGQRGDLPLESTGGNLIADAIVDNGISAVLDVSDFTGGEMRRFVADFATHLLHRKKSAKSPVMVVWEECQDFVPQKVMHDSARMVGAMERLIKQGRNHGIGTTLISQRPQAVNKDVLNQTECLIVLQTTGPQERKTIQGWVVENDADVEDAVDALPKLERGEAFVWSPQWLRIFQRVKIGKKWTFDASSTPTANQKAARNLAPAVNLDALRAKMADTVERAKAEDPKALRAEVAKLKAELSSRQKSGTITEIKRVEVPVIQDSQIRRLESFAARLAKEAETLRATASEIGSLVRAKMSASVPPLRPVAPISSSPRHSSERPANIGDPSFSGPQQRMLDALASFEGIGISAVSRNNVAVFSDQSPRSSGFANNLSALRSMGAIVYPMANMVTLSDVGRARANRSMAPATLAQLHDAWCAKLSAPQQRMVRALIAIHPRSLTREELAEQSSQSSNSSGYANNLSALRGLGVIDYLTQGAVVATDLLFPAALGAA